jgi:hypothetical protein
MNLKSLARKLSKLEASMQKDAKRLSKLIRKIKRADTSEPSPKARKSAKSTADATAPSAPAKQKRRISPEARAKLSSLMHERWAAKRAAVAPGNGNSEEGEASAPDGVQQ